MRFDFPVARLRVMMPLAWPFTSTTSSISVCGYISTVPASICRQSD
jgi:hypothetical protein